MRSPLAGRVLAAVAASLALAWPAHAAGQDEAFALVREEQTATAALKRAQPLSETPSSVSVISGDEIRAMGYRTLGEALRWVRGLFATYDRNYTYLGVRGLQRPGDYNNKVLLTLDGHTLNGGIYDDAYFGTELGLDMEAVERIEVVRGPGSALYGSDAVLAVVQVVTRQARHQRGLTVNGWAGGAGERRGHVQLGAGGEGGPELMATASWLDSDGGDLYFPAFDTPASDFGRATGVDGERGVALLGTLAWGELRGALKVNERRKNVPTASFGTAFGDPRYQTWDGHDFAELSGRHTLGSRTELVARGWWDAARYHGLYPEVYDPDSAAVMNRDAGDSDELGTELRAHWSPGVLATWTAGIEARRHVRERLRNADLDPARVYIDRQTTRTLLAGYLQHELRWGPALITSGARIDSRVDAAPVASPRLDVVLRTSRTTRFKLLTGSAFRAPTAYETEYVSIDQIGADLKPEFVSTVEGVLEHAAGPLTASLGTYRNSIRDLVDLARIDDAGTVQFQNLSRVRSNGVEGELQVVPSAGNRARLAVAWQHSVRVDDGVELTDSPRWNAHLLVTHAPPLADWSVGGGIRYLSPRGTLAGGRTPADCVADARVARRLGAGELALTVRNLFDARTADPGSSEHRMDVIPQDGRTVYAEASLHMGPR